MAGSRTARPPRWLLPISLLVALAAGHPVPAGAQGPATLEGIVRAVGDSGTPVVGAQILLDKIEDQTDARGRFRIEGINPGEYNLLIRRIGFEPIRRRITVHAGSPTQVEVYMKAVAARLPDVVVAGERRGFYGVVRDPGSRPVPGAKVELLGDRGGEAVTDSAGRFAFPDAKGGGYLMRVTRQGYQERRLPLDLPGGKGQEVTVQLAFGLTGMMGTRAATAWFDFGRRMAWARRQDVMIGKDLERYGDLSICDVPRIRSDFGDQPAAVLNGDTQLLPGQVCMWQMSELAIVEASISPTRRGPDGRPARRVLVVWEKR